MTRREHDLGGTLLNAIAVLCGGLAGLVLGQRLSARLREAVVSGIGLVTFAVGISNASQTGNIIIPLVSIVSGVIVGELLDVDGACRASRPRFRRALPPLPVPAQASATRRTARRACASSTATCRPASSSAWGR